MRNGLGIISGSRRRVTGFSPSDLSPAIWLDAADSSTLFDAVSGGSTPADAGTVRRWQDKSGNLRHVTEATAGPTRRTGLQNGKDVVRFAGSNKLAHSSNSVWNFLHNGGVYWVFIAAVCGTTPDPGKLMSLISTSGWFSANVGIGIGLEDRPTFDNALWHAVSNGAGSGQYVLSDRTNNTLSPQTFSLITVKGDPENPTNANRSIMRVNELALANANTLGNADTNANSTYPLQIGNDGAGSFPLTGDIGEIIIVSGDLTTTQRNDCEAYLRNKWGTPSPS